MNEPTSNPRLTTVAGTPAIYTDILLRVLLVVEAAGELWLVPRRPGGWASRQRLNMTLEARRERLRPARNVSAGWLGLYDEGRQEGPSLARHRAYERQATPATAAVRGHLRDHGGQSGNSPGAIPGGVTVPSRQHPRVTPVGTVARDDSVCFLY